MKVVLGLLVLVSIGATANAQSGLGSIAGAGVREDRTVGVVAAVLKGKDTLLLEAYGKADVEGDVPATVDTMFPIGSVTTQFTAAAILQLRDQVKLSLDDEITKWLLVRLGSAMLKPGLLRADTIATFQTPTRLVSGASTTYALGWTIASVQLAGEPARMVSHRGSPAGGTVSLLTFPELGLAIAVAANVTDATGVHRYALQVAEAFTR